MQAADQLTQQIPSSLQDSTFHAVQTSAGQLELFADISGESIATASAAQIATNNAEKIAASIAKAQELSNKLYELTQPDPVQVQAFDASIKPYLNSDKLYCIFFLRWILFSEERWDFKFYTKIRKFFSRGCGLWL